MELNEIKEIVTDNKKVEDFISVEDYVRKYEKEKKNSEIMVRTLNELKNCKIKGVFWCDSLSLTIKLKTKDFVRLVKSKKLIPKRNKNRIEAFFNGCNLIASADKYKIINAIREINSIKMNGFEFKDLEDLAEHLMELKLNKKEMKKIILWLKKIGYEDLSSRFEEILIDNGDIGFAKRILLLEVLKKIKQELKEEFQAINFD